MAGPRDPRRRRCSAEGVPRGEIGTSAGEVAVATVISRPSLVAVAPTANDLRPTTKRRLIALLAVVRKAVSLFPAIPHFPLSDLSDRVRQSYRAVHGAHRWPARHQSPPRISDRTVHSRGRTQSSPEESRNSYDGRPADCHLYCDSDTAVGGPDEPIRVDCHCRNFRLCRYRFQ